MDILDVGCRRVVLLFFLVLFHYEFVLCKNKDPEHKQEHEIMLQIVSLTLYLSWIA